jgi:hypothetical protein
MSVKTHDTGRLASSGRKPATARIRHGLGGSETAHLFLIRLWRETRDSGRLQPAWRGTVSDLHGHQLGSFGLGQELIDILIASSKVTAILQPQPQDDDRLER